MRFIVLSLVVLCMSVHAADVSWTGKWKVTTTADAEKCCIPTGTITAKQTDQTVEASGVWPDSAACKALGAKAGAAWTATKDVATDGKLVLTIKTSDAEEPKTVKVTLTQKEDKTAATLVQTVEEGTCAATLALEKATTTTDTPTTTTTKVDWTGKWKVTTTADAEKCCIPTGTITAKQTDKSVEASGVWPDSAACKALGAKAGAAWTATKDVATDGKLVLTIKTSDAEEPKTVKVTLAQKEDKTAATLVQTVEEGTCAADLALEKATTPADTPAPTTWTGRYKVVTTADAAKCCLPTGTINAKQTDKTVDFTGMWPASEACKAAGIKPKTHWTAKQSTVDEDGKITLSIRIQKSAFEPIGATVVRDTKDKTAGVFTLTKDTTCTASLVVDNAPKATHVSKEWFNKYNFEVTDEATKTKCCLPESATVFAKGATDEEIHISMLFPKTDLCTAAKVPEGRTTEGTVAVKDATSVEVSYKVGEGEAEKEVLSGTITKSSDGTFEYSGAGGADGKTTCKAKLSLKERVPQVKQPKVPQVVPVVPTTGGAQGAQTGAGHAAPGQTTATGGDAGHGTAGHVHKDAPKKKSPWIWVGIAVLVVLIIFVVYFVVRRQQAAKLSNSLKGAQQESLLAQ